MNKIALIIITLTLGVSCISDEKKQQGEQTTDRGYIVEVGDIAPDFTTTLMDGTPFTLSAQRGKVVMLQFTASWCGVCHKEMPFIEREIYQLHKDKDFLVIGIDFGESLETMQKFARETGISYPLALDLNGDIFGLYAHKNAGVTRNVIINREGKIICLTRLFNREEFDAMKKVIAKELSLK